MVQIQVTFHGTFRHITQVDSDIVEFSQSTLEGVVQELGRRYGQRFMTALRTPQRGLQPGMTVLVDGGRRADWETVLADGSHVAFLSAIAGGAAGPTAPPTYPYVPHVVPPEIAEREKEPPVVLFSAETPTKILAAIPGICVGCRLCELACALTHSGTLNPYLAQIKVTPMREDGVVEPVICMHCNPAACEAACPPKALFWAPHLPGVLLLDESKCDKCYKCVYACPFGAIQIGPGGEVLKCDLCDGDPACVQVCQERPEFKPPHWTEGRVSCLQYLEPHQATLLRRVTYIEKKEKKGRRE